jgi:hypothetical protein
MVRTGFQRKWLRHKAYVVEKYQIPAEIGNTDPKSQGFRTSPLPLQRLYARTLLEESPVVPFPPQFGFGFAPGFHRWPLGISSKPIKPSLG